MQCDQFQQILNAIPLLTNQQRNILTQALSKDNSTISIEQTIEASFEKSPKCPHCQSEDLQRWGVRNRRQRYRCKVCRKTLKCFF